MLTAERILVDTNLVVYHLGGRSDATRALQGVEVHITFITEIELQSKVALTEVDLKSIRAAMANYRISDIDRAIKQLAAQLRRSHGFKLADAIVAATALQLNIPLLTADGGSERLKDVVDLRTL